MHPHQFFHDFFSAGDVDLNFYTRDGSESKYDYFRVEYVVLLGTGGTLPKGFRSNTQVQRIVGPDNEFWYVDARGLMERDTEVRRMFETRI